MRGVLSHSRERTKGRPVAAKPRQHHGCPRPPPRWAWGRNLMLRKANCFLAGAAWNALGCYACCTQAVGRHRWAALVARKCLHCPPFPGGEGVTAQAVTDRGSPAGSASRRARMRAVTPASPARPPRAGPPRKLQAGPTRVLHARRRSTQSRAGCGHCPLPRRGRCHGASRDG